MQIQYTGRNMKVSDALRELTEKKFDRLAAHFDNITSAHFIFAVNGNRRQFAEATVNLPGCAPIIAKDESEDMYKTIDLVIKKLKTQLMKYKEKLAE